MKQILLFLILLIFLLPFSAMAETTVTMNGIDITGIYGQKFTNVSIEFDNNGNIIIDAPQYHLVDQNSKPTDPTATKVVMPSADTIPKPTPAAPQIQTLPNSDAPTYLIGSFNYPGLLGYNIDVYINHTFVKTILQGEAQTLTNISSYLHKGNNIIEYKMVMAADSGTSSKATVEFSLGKQTSKSDNSIELSGQYAPVVIKAADGIKPHSVEFIIP